MDALEGIRGRVEDAEAELEQLRAAETAAAAALAGCEKAIRDGREPAVPNSFSRQTVPFEEQLRDLRHEAELARLRREGALERLEQAQARLAEVEAGDLPQRYEATLEATNRAAVFEDLARAIEGLQKLRRYEVGPHPAGIDVTVLRLVEERPDPTAEDHAEALKAFSRDELKRGKHLRTIAERLERHRAACEELPQLAKELALKVREFAPVEQQEIDALVALGSAPTEYVDNGLVDWTFVWARTFQVPGWNTPATNVRGNRSLDPLEFSRLAVELGDARDAFYRLEPPEPPKSYDYGIDVEAMRGEASDGVPTTVAPTTSLS